MEPDDTTQLATDPVPAESSALVRALNDSSFEAPTACAGWQVRHVAAHLAAGADRRELDLGGRGPAGGDAVTLDAAHRLLTLWARRSRLRSAALS